jgi:hypothetical protein
MLGLDYAGGHPGGAAITAAGYAFVCRYLSPGGPSLPGKLLTQPEYADLMAHGVAVVVNWETTADRMKAGRAAGVADAQMADVVARGVGHPADRPIYFSADFDATPDDQVAIDAYLRGAATVIGLGRVGVYGSYYVCQRCLDNGTAAWVWQTGAWSGGRREPRAHIYQRIGTVTVGDVACDVNEALVPDFGQHPHQEDDVPWKLTRTEVKAGANFGDAPDASWPAIEDTITLSGPVKVIPRITFGFGGGWVQEAWWGVSDGRVQPAAVHIVEPPGVSFAAFWPNPPEAYQTPDNARYLVIRYAAPSGGSINFEPIGY